MIMLPRTPHRPRYSPSAEVVRRFVARVNAHDLAGIGLLIPTDAAMIDSLGFQFVGWDQVTAAWRSLLRAIPSYKIEADSIVSEGPVVAVRGWSIGTWIDDASRDRVFRLIVPATWYATVRGPWIAEWRACVDSALVQRERL
jgi:SnoaL-like protein